MKHINTYENKKEEIEDVQVISDIINIMQFINHTVEPNRILKTRWNRNKIDKIYYKIRYDGKIGIDVSTLLNKNFVHVDLKAGTTKLQRKEILKYLIENYPKEYEEHLTSLNAEKYNL